MRTTEDKVKDVLADDYGPKMDGTFPNLIRYISIAHNLTNRVATCATAKDRALSDDELTELETWLAAHYYTRSDKTLASTSTMGASGSYQGQTGMGLQASFYGQSALDMDISGCLKSLTSQSRVSASWTGKPPSEQIDYVDRD